MNTLKILRVLVLLVGMLFSTRAVALAGQSLFSSTDNTGGGSSAKVVFTGAIESMNGSQWVINGQTVNVDTASLQDSLTRVGEMVTIAGVMADDGSVNAQSVEFSSSSEPGVSANSKSENASMHNGQGSNSSLEAIGLVEAISTTSMTVGRQVYTFAPGAEIKGSIKIGRLANVHFMFNADGSRSITEIVPSDLELGTQNHQGDNHSTDVNQNSPQDDKSYDDESDHESESSSFDDDDEDDHSNNMNYSESDDEDHSNDSSTSSYHDD